MAKKQKRSSNFIKIFGFILAGVALLILLTWGLLNLNAKHIYDSNPAKKSASIMLSFAHENNLEKLYEYNGPATGLDNTTPYFVYEYQGTKPVEEMYNLLKAYLEKNGYSLKDALYTYDSNCYGYISSTYCSEEKLKGFTQNEGKPYMVFEGENANRDSINGEITDKTYKSFSKTEDTLIEAGKSVLTITFTSTSSTF